MELNRLQKLAGLPLTEAKTKEIKLTPVEKTSYDDSSDFEEAYSSMMVSLKHTEEILKSLAMKEWMKSSKENFSKFDTDKYIKAKETAKRLHKELGALHDALVDLN